MWSCPIAETKNWLLQQEGVTGVLMSGSGSTVFALVQDSQTGEALAKAAKEQLDSTLWTEVCEL